MWVVFLLAFFLGGGTLLKIVGALAAIKNGTYAKRKAKQFLWKKVRKMR